MFNYALIFVLAGQILVTSTPYFQSIFQTASLTIFEWAYLICITSSVFFLEEARKRYQNGHNQLRSSDEMEELV
jgi:Ca2+-transporting ATPase